MAKNKNKNHNYDNLVSSKHRLFGSESCFPIEDIGIFRTNLSDFHSWQSEIKILEIKDMTYICIIYIYMYLYIYIQIIYVNWCYL